MSSLIDGQRWNPESYSENARFVSDLGLPLVDLLNPQRGERILDLGCGDGALTIEIQKLGCQIVAVDASPEMVSGAVNNGIDAIVANGMELSFSEEFDAVFSNAALHWMPEAEAVVDGIWRALKPDGRFVAEFGGRGNVETIINALDKQLAIRGHATENPWFFPSAELYGNMLQARGFSIDSIETFSRPTPLPGSVIGWLATFAQHYTKAMNKVQREQFLRDVCETLRPVLCDEQGDWFADYVRLRVIAQKPV